MKKIIFTTLFLSILFCLQSNAEEYYLLCKTTSNLNLRECPSSGCEKICSIPRGAYVVAILDDDVKYYDGDFVHCVYVDKDIYGYVCIDYLRIEKELETSHGGLLNPSGESYGYDPEIEITNQTSRNISVKVNKTTFKFTPEQVRTITCAPGTVSILASSPGVIPFSGTDYVKENGKYTWKFYIITGKR